MNLIVDKSKKKEQKKLASHCVIIIIINNIAGCEYKDSISVSRLKYKVYILSNDLKRNIIIF